MRAGDGFTAEQRLELQGAVASVERSTGLAFSLYVGPLEGGRASAEERHAAAPAPGRTVLVAVDPGSRRLEIVTGAEAGRFLDDRTCGLATLSMTSSFSQGDLVGGIKNGLQLLGDHARHDERRHLDTL